MTVANMLPFILLWWTSLIADKGALEARIAGDCVGSINYLRFYHGGISESLTDDSLNLFGYSEGP